MDLKLSLDLIISADFLGNEGLFDEMMTKVFHYNSEKDINAAVSHFEDGTIVRLLDDFQRRNEVLVTFYHDKLKYFDQQSNQCFTITQIPEKVRTRKKACAIKDKIYIIGADRCNQWTHVAEYNTQTKSWRTILSASFKPLQEELYGVSAVTVDFLCSVGNK